MKCIALMYTGPFASFGCNSKSDFRETTFFPTKSAVFGLLLAACGKKGTEAELKTLCDNVSIESFDFSKQASYLHDFQTIGMDYGEEWQSLMTPSKYGSGKPSGQNMLVKKVYLEDEKFGIVLEVVDDQLADELSEKLLHPVWPLFLGRKNCIPTCRIYQGTFSSKEESLKKLEEQFECNPTSMVSEKKLEDYDESFFINDVPIKFCEMDGDKRVSRAHVYSSRKVYVKKLAK